MVKGGVVDVVGRFGSWRASVGLVGTGNGRRLVWFSNFSKKRGLADLHKEKGKDRRSQNGGGS
ncbi:hypothetical protein NC651_036785 [Populus alba x Populus x berolinensis]|nr:hypothetical protein NC651_036785 [Populus alba x Populus x berolinensis]